MASDESLALPGQESSGRTTARSPLQPWRIAGLLLPFAFLGLMEVLVRTHVVPEHLVPAPSSIVETLWQLGGDRLARHIGASSLRVFAGFAIGAVVAIFFGAAMGLSRRMDTLLDPSFQALRAIPSLAWVPVLLLWMGIDEAPKITLIAIGAFFPVHLSVVAGIRGVDRKLIELGEVNRLSQRALFTRILLPASLPHIFTGLRTGLSLAWMFMVAAELIAATRGLGYLLSDGRETGRPDLVFGAILLLALLGKLSDSVLKAIETHVLSWRRHKYQKQPMSAPLLDLRVSAKHYDTRTILERMTLTIQRGEIVSLVGPSGCGKSTLLRILAGLDRDFNGEILIDGKPQQGPSSRIGVIFQEPRLLPWLSVADNVAFPAGPRRGRDPRVGELLAEVGLAEARAYLPKQLSGGMAQRVAIARGLFSEPDLLLLDEPFSAVDAMTRMRLQDLLLSLVRSHGTAALLVTHDLDEALYLSDRVLLMTPSGKTGAGRIVREIEVSVERPRDRRDVLLASLRGELLEGLGAVVA